MLRSYQILVSTVLLGASALSLSACGQRGPLYLPTEPAPASATPPAHAASAASPAPQ